MYLSAPTGGGEFWKVLQVQTTVHGRCRLTILYFRRCFIIEKLGSFPLSQLLQQLRAKFAGIVVR